MTPRPESLRGATITGTGMYVPERVLTNADFERMVDTSDEWIVERTGIRERHIVAPGQASSDLAVEAAQRALDVAGLAATDVDQIIVATTTPDRLVPSCACTVQAKLGARNAAAFDLFAACSGFIYALNVGRSIISSGTADTVLVIGVEVLTSITDFTDRNTCVLFGDGAGAVVLRPCGVDEGILSVSIHSDGTLGDLIEMPAGGSSLPASHDTVDRKLHFLRMRGKELFKMAVRGMEESLLHALEVAGVTPDELELVIPHQANQRIIDAMRERVGLRSEKIVLNIERYGNTSSASIPISLDEVVRAGRLKPGDRLGLVAFGGGATWGATVLRWTMPAYVRPEAIGSAAGAMDAVVVQ
jgi:3-oxoacyl-[acyl-carrier-protein] synthase III